MVNYDFEIHMCILQRILLFTHIMLLKYYCVFQFQHELFPVEETLQLLSLMIADGCSVTVSSKIKVM